MQARNKYFIWFFAALFYAYQYILRVSPNFMVADLRSAFLLSAEEFATLGSFCLVVYSLLQIPVGVLVDKIGPRRVILFSIFLCVIGNIVFTLAHNLYMAQIARVIIGIGSAPAFLCALKIVADNFQPGNRGLLTGLTLTTGVFGASMTAQLVLKISSMYGWRGFMVFSALLGVLLIICTYIVFRGCGVPEEKIKLNLSFKSMWVELLPLLKDRTIIIYSVLATGLYAPLSTLADLWGTSFLTQKFSLDHSEAAHTSVLIYVGVALGSALLPWLFERYNKIKLGVTVSNCCILVTFGAILYGPVMTIPHLAAFIIMLGFWCGTESICFTGALQFSHHGDKSGQVIGLVNTLNMLGAAILQQLVGVGLDLQWQGATNKDGLRLYNTQEFVNSLSLLTFTIVACLLISLTIQYMNNDEKNNPQT
jgi:MFS family permease